jgi:uncharacterized protein
MAGARAILIAFALALGAAMSALALDFPTLSGRVVDEAGTLDAATRAALTQKLADLEAKTTDQIVVVTLKSLQGTSIEHFGVELARHWKIGQKDKNNGVLLIVVPSERRVRIEVGRGLEGTLTDAISRLIIENGILPRFRANDFPGGITRGVDDIISVLTGDAAEWKARAAKRPNPAPTWDPFMVLFLLFFAGVLVYIIMGAAYGGRKKRRWSDDFVWSSGPGTSWTPDSSSGGFSGGGDFSGGGGGGFSGGGGDFGGGGASGSW